MRWITGITLDNYRAFANAETISVPFGHHLLIYGENGSGKSSVYNGVKDFFSSSDTQLDFRLNVFEQVTRQDGRIALRIASGPNLADEVEFVYAEPMANSTHQLPEIRSANKIKGFLDYRRLLKIHALDTSPDNQPNVFELLVRDLLGEHLVDNPKGGVGGVELWKTYADLVHILMHRGTNTNQFKAATEELVNLDVSLQKLLRNVFARTNELLESYFRNKLAVDMQYQQLARHQLRPGTDKSMVEEVKLRVYYAGEERPDYHVFLNEARLSALAICLYLASIKTYPYESADLRILFLDDVFIGLDTSNRLPLLEIIKNEFIGEGFQVIISTYDRQWFEFAKHWFETFFPGNVKAIEMFTGSHLLADGSDVDDLAKPDFPVLVDSLDYLTSARGYLEAKDYPASGNYLRKACEHALRSLLPDTRQYDANNEPITSLESLHKAVVKWYEDCSVSCPTAITESVVIFRKALLNPSSHDDLRSPLYRRELVEAIRTIELVRTEPMIFRRRVLRSGDRLTLRHPTELFTAELEVIEHVDKVEYSNVRHFTELKCHLKKWTHDGVDFSRVLNGQPQALEPAAVANITSQDYGLEQLVRMSEHGSGLTFPQDQLSCVSVDNTDQTMRDLLQ